QDGGKIRVNKNIEPFFKNGGIRLLCIIFNTSLLLMTLPAPGILLIADPFLKDPNFMRTVVLLTEHREDGTIGFVLNRQYENTLDELIPEVEGHKLPVYYGGPVQMNTIHFLHRYPDEIQGGIEVLKGIYWGGDFDAVIDLINNGKADPEKIRFYIGYSGWSSGQLDTEMTEKTWLTVEAVKKLVFHPNAEEIWRDSLKHMGGEYEMMINFPIDPQLN
ncbi:MAG: YqgE/AlgH family protein, partial [Flavisolibacter sp.]